MNTDKKLLEKALRKSWSAETSFLQDQWNESNPSRGQCAVTALVIQDYLGGEILKCTVVTDNDKHFFNVLDNGDEIDFTREQYESNEKFGDKEIADRKKILSHPGTQQRYVALKNNVAQHLA